MNTTARMTAALTAGALLCTLSLYPLISLAQDAPDPAATTPAEIQGLIDAHNTQIAELDKEIAQYEKQLQAVGSKKKTLQNELDQINLSLKKSAASIAASKKKISSTQLQIQQLAQGIAVKQGSIETDAAGLAESFRQMHESEGSSLAVQLLASDDIVTTWRELDSHQTLQEAVSTQMDKLAQEKQSLSDVKKKTEAKRAELLAQQQTLLAEQGTLSATKKAQNELLGGRIDFMVDTGIFAFGQIRGAKIRPLAISSGVRYPLMPDIPTIAETVPGIDMGSWLGLVVTPGTPRSVVDRLNRELRSILGEADVRKRLADLASVPFPSSPEEMSDRIEREMARWRRVVELKNIERE